MAILNYANSKIWIIGVSNETGYYTPTLVKISQYKKETGLKTVIGWQSYDDCLVVCKQKNVKEGRYNHKNK